MSFRTRLTLFFIIIVIVPMVAVAVVLFRLVTDSERGKADARLAQGQTTAMRLRDQAIADASRVGLRIGEAPGLAIALRDGGRDRIERELEGLRRRTGAARVVLEVEGEGRFAAGRGPALAPATTTLESPGGRVVGTVTVSTLTPDELTRQIEELTRLEAVAISGDREVLAATVQGDHARPLPERGETRVAGRRHRFTTFPVDTVDGEGDPASVRLLADERATETAVSEDSLLVALLLVAFLVLAFAFALAVSRSLQAQVSRLLHAARRIGAGDLSVQVPTEGNDEFAALGNEFNEMARELQGRLAELENERGRLQQAIRRVGESFAKGLDRDALLDIVVQTAMDGAGATAGRARVRDEGQLVELARLGDLRTHEPILRAVEERVLAAREPAELTLDGSSALAHPLKPSDGGSRVLGIVAVARRGREFSDDEKELFNYLATQAAVSIENVDLHETVQRQAVTDELTGLFNHRRFQEVITVEVERVRRFGSRLGLIMIDLDDFKNVNDTYGHLQGDLVLKEVARVLLESSREIDEPARYGGEEMAVALPQTDLEGAALFAERLRRRVEALRIPIVDGPGTLQVTASFGCAAVPESAPADKDALVAAADSALYRAKRAGKNRVAKAG